MTDLQKSHLTAAGIDISDALPRFMGNEALLERFLKKFLQDENYRRLQDAVRDGNLEGAITASHTLKGLCGNLSLSRLYSLFARQVDFFRSDGLAEGAALMDEISDAHQEAVRAISEVFSL